MKNKEFFEKMKNVPDVAFEEMDVEDRELFEMALEEKEKEFTGKVSLRLPKELQSDLFYEAKRQGVSLNQLCLYKLAQSTPHTT